MYYINAISSITHQPSFENKGFSKSIQQLGQESELINPDYKRFIDPKLIRRMSKILRMGVACSYSCLEEAKVETPEAIIVGTGLGCLTDTLKFLDTYIKIDGLLPPTSFIQSTHNTIAGQISLALKNHSYNTTYTQNSVSFEVALGDAMMCLDEGMDNVLVGAADEYVSFFEKTPFAELNLTSGATFLVLSKYKTSTTLAQVKKVYTAAHSEQLGSEVQKFLDDAGVSEKELSKVYYSTPFNEKDASGYFGVVANKIRDFAGIYPTNSAFGLHLAADEIASGEASQLLICNQLTRNNLGLTLIAAV